MLSACTGVHNHPYAYISGMLIMFLSFFFIGSTSQDQRIGNHLGVFWEMITWRGQSSRTGTDRVTVTNQMIAVIMISCRINVVPRESHPSNVWEALHVYGALMSWWCHFYWRLSYTCTCMSSGRLGTAKQSFSLAVTWCWAYLALFPGPRPVFRRFRTASDGKLGGAWERG